jgi:calcium-dependent protein kinase
VDFLKALLERDPALRPSAAQALEHPWVKDEGTAGDLPLEGSVVQVGGRVCVGGGG